MSRSKENISYETRSHFIRYLYQEGQRKGAHKDPNFYPELIKFVDTTEGQDAFIKFSRIDQRRVGIPVQSAPQLIKRAFTL
ncbi:hypothetical protein UFOVP685_34 [uncultured Caudovirales phage]|uniref:Uncharacterized protein n=1 Tax=uncultured Caudovirales phage TaxID=2100421 RepID=A0A6J5N480_9CAUD|nr:hypothetical protein UFOVP590_50 [uncultured Caudovirales phage]CAB4157579.1 hypothetical protein UFOVP685_34 [uncultured Caudovirales phage]CAB5225363.1 hypothetical protein UFOVP750_18 [uncultured Caudovirales phage]